MITSKIRTLIIAIWAMVTSPILAQITMNIDATKRGPRLNTYQYGLFFEEINHAGDGGLYAELVRNRSFEEGINYWGNVNNASTSIVYSDLLNNAQECALMINANEASANNLQGVSNTGFWGMNITADSTYNLSLWIKGPEQLKGNLYVQLVADDNSTIIANATIQGEISPDSWQKLTATFKATGTNTNAYLQILTTYACTFYIDVVSLFPYTWKNRNNGLRPDLAQLLADTKPSFIRFPGGCYVEGQGSYDNAFQWKKTIGGIEERPGHWNNNWGYRSSDGLGFDEYLQMCEDMNATPLFVVNVGLGHDYVIPLSEMEEIVQDALDAIEYANGGAETEWGAKRIANGHAEPYGLKFIEIGNENYQTDNSGTSEDYAERYYMFYKAIKEAYPDITLIGNVEAWGTDNPSWRNEYPVEMVDEHYYRSNAWMVANYSKYDAYPRTIGIYNGEYAANESGTYGTYGNLTSALGEAVYMLGMEKNSDVCLMASFAPIFVNTNDVVWAYDMIHFNAYSHFVTPSYYVQKMLSTHRGGQNLLWTESGNELSKEGVNRKVGLGTWLTKATYDNVSVTDLEGNVLASDDFSNGIDSWELGIGTWKVSDEVLVQSSNNENCTAILNVPLDTDSYIYHVRARKDSGNEGFLIILKYTNSNNYVWWNIGGWTNTMHAVESCVAGSKTTVASTYGSVNTNQWYDIQIKVEGNYITCMLDGNVIHEFTLNEVVSEEKAVYQSVQLDEQNGDVILKVVNTSDVDYTLTLNATNMTLGSGNVCRLTSNSGTDENTMEQPDNVVPTEENINASDLSSLRIPAYSLNIFTLGASDIQPEESVVCEEYEKEDADKYGYLFAHMHTTEERTCFALSQNASYWRDLFDSKEVFDTKKYTQTGGMRDAYVCRTQGGNFMLAGTDMTSSLGWTSNHIMSFMRTNDLVHWDRFMQIDLETAENLSALGLNNADDMTAAWAPQIIYDPVTQSYVLYYSVGFPDRHRIYYSLTDEDLSYYTTPKLLFDPGYDVIDADIIWNDVDKQYVMIMKREGESSLGMAVADHLVPTDQEGEGSCQWKEVEEFGIEESGESIEAPSQFRYIGSTTWKLGYQKYSNGYSYRLMNLDEHSLNPSNRTDIQGDLNPQHGSFVKLTEREYNHLLTWEAVVDALDVAEALSDISPSETLTAAITKANNAINNDAGSFDANESAMQEALNALESVEQDLKQSIVDKAKAGEAVDMTALLVNPNFANGSKGWSTSPSFTAANGYVAEYYNTTFYFSQTVEDLPAGAYRATVQSFYRNGDINTALASHNNGSEKLNAFFFANSAEVAVMSLYDNSITTYSQSPYNYPDNVTEANTAYNTNNLYTNTIDFTLETSGDITVGIYKNVSVSYDWCCFDNFTLEYLGTLGIKEIGRTKTSTNKVYNLSGQRVDYNKAPRGVYIVNEQKTAKVIM